MRFYEFEAKKMFQKVGVPLLPQVMARDVDEAKQAAERIGLPVVVKSQVLSGGRMKAGGVRFAESTAQVEKAADEILKLEIAGSNPIGILVEKRAYVEKEYYLAATYDGGAKKPIVMMSDMGGIDVEEVADEYPEHIVRRHISALLPFSDFQSREIVSSLGFEGRDLRSISRILSGLTQAFLSYDLTLAEINPLGRLTDGSFACLDAHVEMEDEAKQRQEALLAELGVDPERTTKRPSELERKAAEIDASDHRGVAGRMVEFDGSLGLIIGGGGASLTAFDAVRRHGGKPANYCEIGGNPSVNKVCQLTKLLLAKPNIEKIAVIMNVVNNTRVDIVARGVIKGVVDMGFKPSEKIAIFRIPGAWEEEGFKILSKYGVKYLGREASIDEAVREGLRG